MTFSYFSSTILIDLVFCGAACRALIPLPAKNIGPDFPAIQRLRRAGAPGENVDELLDLARGYTMWGAHDKPAYALGAGRCCERTGVSIKCAHVRNKITGINSDIMD